MGFIIFNPDYPLKMSYTPQEIENALKSDDRSVRLALAQSTDTTFTKKQIDLGLRDRYSDIRAAFASRPDFRPTPKQIERGLTDYWLVVRKSFYMRDDVSLTFEQMKRMQLDVRFDLEPTDYENYDEEYILQSPQCPYCKARVFGDGNFCDHVAFLYSTDFGIAAENGATQEQIDFVGDGDSRRKFDLLCNTFKLKKREWIEEGMACGPVTSRMTIAYGKK